MAMERKTAINLAKGYSFAAYNALTSKLTNAALNMLAYFDFRILVLLSMWHPDMECRKKFLRMRGVDVPEHCWIDLGVWIELTTPKAVILEDYVKLAYGCNILAHDAGLNSMYSDIPMRVMETRIGYNSAIGAYTTVYPGVNIGDYSGAAPGSVIIDDVPDFTLVGGNPARPLLGGEEMIVNRQEDMKARPEIYFDHPNPAAAPSSPYDHLITWREEGTKIRDYSDIRTGTPFDYILDYQATKKSKD
jgi:acetyltransferase-like isoleucine patch superfamily enzyme